MTILNRNEIKEKLGDSIIIHPYDEKYLKGIGYNFRAGPLAWSVNSKKPLPVVEKDGTKFYIVSANDVALVMTREIISVDETIAGTFHSKVDKVSIGFSHVSTTLDPGWIGPLLISIANNKNKDLLLRIDDTFITLIFYDIKSTEYTHHNPGGRTDIIQKLGLEVTDLENKWLYKEWRTSKKGLKKKYDNNIADDDTEELILSKLREINTKKIKKSKLFKYILPPVTILVFGLVGFWVFGNKPGFIASVATGVAISQFVSQYLSKQ